MPKKQKLSIEAKVALVRRCLAGEIGVGEAARRTGIHHTTMLSWIVQYEAEGIAGFLPQERNRVYAPNVKKEAVENYLSGEGSITEICKRYKIRDTHILRNWIKVYNSGRGFRQKMSGGSRMKEARPTTVEERIQIAKDCIANGGNYGETALKFNVSYQQVYQWVKKFKEKGDAGLEDRRGKRLKDQTPRTREEELEIEIAKLKHELYMTKMERDVSKKLDEIERREVYRK